MPVNFLEMSEKFKHIISVLCVVAAIVIAFVALFLPPVGIIDSSVLWYIAQSLLFSASIIGIDFKIADVFKSQKNKS